MRMEGYFELKPFFEGQVSSVYLFEFGKVGFPMPELTEEELLDPELGKERLEELGYRLWTSDQPYVPTHQIQWQDKTVEYYNLEGAAPPTDVTYSWNKENPGWLLDKRYACRRRFIPKVFNLYYGHWVVDENLVYPHHKYGAELCIADITPAELAWLESIGVTETTFCFGEENRIYGKLKGAVPTSFALQRAKWREYSKLGTNLAKLCENHIPLWIDFRKDRDYCHFKVDGAYWRMRKKHQFSPIEAKELFGIKHNVEVSFERIKPEETNVLPLAEIESVGEDDVLRCQIYEGDLAISLPRLDRPQDNLPASYSELHLKRDFYYFAEHGVVLVSSSDTAQSVESYGLKRLTNRKHLLVARIRSGKVEYLPEYYTFSRVANDAKNEPN